MVACTTAKLDPMAVPVSWIQRVSLNWNVLFLMTNLVASTTIAVGKLTGSCWEFFSVQGWPIFQCLQSVVCVDVCVHGHSICSHQESGGWQCGQGSELVQEGAAVFEMSRAQVHHFLELHIHPFG